MTKFTSCNQLIPKTLFVTLVPRVLSMSFHTIKNCFKSTKGASFKIQYR